MVRARGAPPIEYHPISPGPSGISCRVGFGGSSRYRAAEWRTRGRRAQAGWYRGV